MNILEEKKQNFDIDKNRQDIRRLEKKNRSQSEDIAALNQFKTQTNSSLTQMQTQLNTLRSDLESLQSGSSADEEPQFMSYDCYKTKDRIYRDICWVPRPIAFYAESGMMFKFRVKFDAVSTFEKTITSTAKIKFDGEEIYSDTKDVPAGGTQSVDFEHITSSIRAGHKIEVELRNTETASLITNCCMPEFLTVELWGTKVQFVSRNNDFSVIPANDKIVMTTTVFDQTQATFSMQTPDSNFSFDESSFKWLKANNYRAYNQVLPSIAHYYDTETNTMVYSDKPTLINHNFQTTATTMRIAYYVDVEGNNEDNIAPTGTNTSGCMIAKPLMANSGNNYSYGVIPDFITITPNGYMFYQRGGSACPILSHKSDYKENFDCCGVMRLENDTNKAYFYGVTTRQDGTSFFWSYKTKTEQQIELGFGTHSNAYLLSNDQIVVFLKIGRDTKKIIFDPVGDEGYYEVSSTSIIPNVQEYWLTPNGTHFERVGNKINFFLSGATTPTKTLTVFC